MAKCTNSSTSSQFFISHWSRFFIREGHGERGPRVLRGPPTISHGQDDNAGAALPTVARYAIWSNPAHELTRISPMPNTPQHHPKPVPEMGPRELATVLAALRFYQEALNAGTIPLHLMDVLTNSNELVPLTGSEIDTLCERLNEGA
jgi:hypothetical protein